LTSSHRNGLLEIRNDFLIEYSGLPDEVAPGSGASTELTEDATAW
jgi:hypothetical protein